jgi:dTDP-glucose 4,6-dehydratase
VEPSEHTPRRVLVTGGAGFIGSHLVRHLLASDPELEVVNLDLLTYAGDLRRLEGVNGHPRLETVVGDICDRPLVDRILADPRLDSILHLAAESHVDRSIAGPGEFIRTNVTGTFTLLEAARQAWSTPSGPRRDVQFVHVSTDEVYGQLRDDDPPFTETSPYAPNSPYAASKAAADHLARAYHRTWGLPVVTTNCSNNYGPFQHGEKFIPTVIRSCLDASPIPLYGDGSNVREWIHVEDHCTALDAVLRRGRPGSTYLVGTGDERPNLEVALAICGIMDELRPASAPHRRLVTFVTDRPGHDWRYALDPSRIRRELGWYPHRDFDSGLRGTVEWFVGNRIRTEGSGAGSD